MHHPYRHLWVPLLLFVLGAAPAAAQCFFADDYANPGAWGSMPNPGISVQNGAVQLTNTTGGTVPSAMRGVFRALPAPLPDGGGWRAEIDLTYNQCGDNSGLMSLGLTAGPRQPFNEFPGGTLIRTPQDAIAIVHTGSLGNTNVPIKPFFSDNGTWGENSNPLLLLQKNGVTTYLRLERLNATMVKMSAFVDAARTQHQAGSPVCMLVPATVQGLNTVWHANLPQGSDLRNDSGSLDNLCLSTIPVLDTTFRVQAAPLRLCLGDTIRLTAQAPGFQPLTWTEASTGWTATGPAVAFVPTAPGLYTFTAAGELREFCQPGLTRRAVRVLVEPRDSAALLYPLAAFCRTGTTAPVAVSPAGGIFSGTPGLVVNAVTGAINLAASTPGPHTVTYTSGGFCPAVAVFPLTINPVTVAALAYGNAAYCQNAANPVPVFSPVGGTFSAPGGLAINPTTGAINLAASAPGTYAVTYTSGGACPDQVSQTLTIRAVTVAALTYPLAAFCRTGTTAPAAVSPAGGTFSGTPGLVINAATGAIDLAASTPGPHTVTYTSGGLCPGQATAGFVINPLDVAAVAYPATRYCPVGLTPAPVVSPAGGVFSGTAGLVLDATTGIVNLGLSAPGAYTVTYTTRGACASQATFSLLVDQLDVAGLTYPATQFCRQGQTTPLPVLNGANGFITGTPGIVVDSATGRIDLGASIPGPHTLTLTTTGQCPVQRTFALTIVAPDAALLAYPGAAFCRGGTSPAPTFSPAGGAFAGSAGLVLDAITGTVDLSASAPGTHTVTYTTTGFCPGQATATLVITPEDSTRLAYGAPLYCQDEPNPAPSFGPAGGTFTGSPGLTLNATTGIIDLAHSTAGRHTVLYTSAGLCPRARSYPLSIVAPDTARLAYPDSVICRTGARLAPQFSPAGGTFLTGPGLRLDPATGEVDLSQSVPGQYTIIYGTTGRCPTEVSVRLLVRESIPLVLPNILTPNGDGLNDALSLRGLDLQDAHLRVFNRWGRLVWESADSALAWHPTAESAGTYYYHLSAADCSGRRQTYKGWVEVVQ